MHVLDLSSPRLRRRLVWVSIGVAVVAAIVLTFLIVPEPKQPNLRATGKQGSAQVAPPVSVKVRPADRRAIDRILDRFIPAGVARRSMATAWRLAGPELKAGSTLTQWRHDDSPIPYYPVAGTTFHDWQPIDVGRNYVEFTLLAYPRHGSRLGAWGFSGEMVRHGSRWLVNRFYTAATYDQAGRQVGPSLTPGQGGGGGGAVGSQLPRGWLIVPIAGVFGVLVLFPLGYFLVSAARDRRFRKRHEAEGLPPLPSGIAYRRWPDGDGPT